MIDSERFAKQMEFIAEIDKLKQVIRQSKLTDDSRQENDSEHSWHIAVMALVLSEFSNTPGISLLRVIKMLLVHDLVEIDAGDTYLYDKEANSDKEEREKEAAARIFGILPADQAKELGEIWEEFEAMSTPEAKFARALDHLQPLILSYHNRGWSWRTHGVVKSQIMESKEPMKEGSTELWEYAKTLLRKAVEAGFLIDE
ncbi:MAG: HD domain-containing protein [Candidatus Thorarchaeota archaeon]|jgi:putative hydrolase of HD superfamily